MDKSFNADEDEYVLVNKEALPNEGGRLDTLRIEDDSESDKSSVCLVEDPAEDPGLFEESEEEDEKAHEEIDAAKSGKDSGHESSDVSETENLPEVNKHNDGVAETVAPLKPKHTTEVKFSTI